MPQETNLNVSPYFDDFDPEKNYYKVLFKPGYPVQARELTTLQSILQNQVEKFGTHVFKEGAKVIPGQTTYNSQYNAVELENSFAGISLSSYIRSLVGTTIRGENSGVRARVESVLTSVESDRDNSTLYVSYISSNSNNNSQSFEDGENLITESGIQSSNVIFIENESFATTISENSTSVASEFSVQDGVYFLRGTFVNVPTQSLLLDQYSNTPSYRIGFNVLEEVITSDIDESLYDNSQGFNNFTAPGADRFKISAILTKKNITDFEDQNFVEIATVQNGILRDNPNDTEYNYLNDTLASRTYEESGDYYVKPFTLKCLNSLNDEEGNNGIFKSTQLTYKGNTPSDDLSVYRVSPGKAYVRGYKVETTSPTFLDVEKPRTTKELKNQSINYYTGPSISLNNVFGSPVIGINTSYSVSLRDSRIVNKKLSSGTEIGVARVYDFALESGSYNTSYPNTNEWDISLYDVQTFTKITLNQAVSLNQSTFIKGKSSGATGFLKNSTSNTKELVLYSTNGSFIKGESFSFDGIDNGRISVAVTSYGLNDVKSLYGYVGAGGTFNADTTQVPSLSIGEATISERDILTERSTVTIPNLKYANILKPGNLLSYYNSNNFIIESSAIVGYTTVAESGQSIFNVSHRPGYSDVYLNGVKLSDTNYTSIGSTVVNLSNPAFYGDVFELNSYLPSARTRSEVIATEGQTIIPFSTTSSLIKDNSILFVNGVKLQNNQFSINTNSDQLRTVDPVSSGSTFEYSTYTKGDKIGLTTVTASSNQSTFSLNYDPSRIEVYVNGIKLTKNEYVATNGSSISLNTPSNNLDVFEVVQYKNGLVSAATTHTSVGLQTSYSASYTPGYVDVFYNGVKLNSSEYTATDGLNVEFTTPAIAGDTVEIVSYTSASRVYNSSTVSESQSDFILSGYDDNLELFVNGVKFNKNDYEIYLRNKSYTIGFALSENDIVDVSHFADNMFTSTEVLVSENQNIIYYNYNVGFLQVYVNGVKFDKTNFEALDSVSIRFSTPFNDGDVVTLYNYSFSAYGSGTDGSAYDPSVAEITSVASNSGFTILTVKGVQSVQGVYNGNLPVKSITVSNLQRVQAKVTKSSDNTLFTSLSRRNVSNVNLLSSNLTIRKQYNVTVSSNSTNTILSGDGETFLPFDEERYVLTFLDGTVESLRSDMFTFGASGTRLTINGTSKNGQARLITTLRKINVTSKVKENKKSTSLVISKSINSSSGIGTTTINDGLEYGNYPYGTRVQDEEISLNVPDIIKLHGVFESFDNTDPSAPKITLTSLTGPNSTTLDLVVGEKIRGTTSGARARYLERTSDSIIEFSYVNEKRFLIGEKVIFEESGIEAIIALVQSPSKDVTSSFILDNGQRDTFYDYGRIRRISGKESPKRKLKIYFQHGFYNTNDDGDITTVNSYNSYNFSKEVPYYNGVRNTDLIDIRPRVSTYTLSSGSKSPFEFDGRLFTQDGNSSKNILAPDESFLVDFSFYLPRIDKVFLNKNGVFKVVNGSPSENPNPPLGLDDSIEIATIFIPPYLYNTNNASVSQKDYKRYTMGDISNLEGRIKNLEKFTTLSLLEADTSNLFIPDENGMNRFKSGFLVDNFKNASNQDVTNGIKNSINPSSGEMRPSHYTSSVDLILGSNSVIGVGDTSNPNVDLNFVSNLKGKNIKKTGDVITLDYSSVEWLSQTFATRSEKVSPYPVSYWQGTVDLTPESDLWVDSVKVDSKNLEVSGNFTSSIDKIAKIEKYDPQIGFIPTIWESWNVIWTGNGKSDKINQSETNSIYTKFFGSDTNSSTNGDSQWIDIESSSDGSKIETISSNEEKTSIQGLKTQEFNSELIGNKKVSTDIIPYIRSRNVQVVSERLKPYTRMYSFFDGVDVNEFVVPKLIEITMNSGAFVIGETIKGFIPLINYSDSIFGANAKIIFRSATPNHKFGPYNSPTETFGKNPYNNDLSIPSQYSSTSTILNVDTFSLSSEVQGEYYGYIVKGMKLYGETSGAEATVQDVRLITDSTGTVIGSFFIPNPNIDVNPKFTSGEKVFKLTNSEQNSSSAEILNSVSESKYLSVGSLQVIEDNIASIKNAKTIQKTLFGGSSSTSFTGKYLDPLAQTFTVDDETGIFLTGLDIFFESKDSELPVTCQIRTVDYNVPSNVVVPFTDVTLYPKSVNTSSDASVATHFAFKSPVYLEGNREYAIVLLSNSSNYSVWTSRLGEVDIKSKSGASSSQILVSTQPILGSLFKSQNAANWQASIFEDLTFKLYRADFVSDGDISFYNPDLSFGNGQIAKLRQNPISTSSRKVRVGLSSALTDTNLKIGNSIVQLTTGANGNYVGFVGKASGLSITNGGIGYSGVSYSNVPLRSITGSGTNATANITISNESVSSVTLVSGGNGYSVGDILTASLGTDNLGTNLQITVTSVNQINQIILDNVQGNFVTGVANTIYRYSDVGVASTILNSDGSIMHISDSVDVINDGLHFKVSHKNHGMHSPVNYVTLNDVLSDVSPSKATSTYDKNYDGAIAIENVNNFINFENLPVSGSNPGYIQVNGEIIKYEGVAAGQLINITRGIDNTIKKQIQGEDLIYKYEFSGVSLRRINKTHRLESSNLNNSIGIDYYNLKIDTSDTTYGTNRGSNQSLLLPLYFNESKSGGDKNVTASQNIPFEAITPNIQSFTPNLTKIDSSMRTISGRSISGSETSFLDQGYESISLNETNYLPTPRIIASKINEKNLLTTLPGNKSFTMLLNLSSDNSKLSPIIDTTRCSVITTSNRVNSAIENYASDYRVNTLFDDPSDCQYVTKIVRLKNPASSLKLYVTAHVNSSSDLRAFYSIDNTESANPVFVPFPGYNNLTLDGQVIDPSLNDGSPDEFINKNYINQSLSTDDSYTNYEFTANNLPDFKYFRIKIIMTSTNQAYVSKIKNMRAVALA